MTTAKLVRGLSDVATTNVCKVDTSNRNHIERSRWMKWLITGLRQKKCPLIWIHYESPLFIPGCDGAPALEKVRVGGGLPHIFSPKKKLHQFSRHMVALGILVHDQPLWQKYLELKGVFEPPPPPPAYSLNKTKKWICSLFKEWILEKSEIRMNLEWTFVLFTHFGVTTGVTPEWPQRSLQRSLQNEWITQMFTPNSL